MINRHIAVLDNIQHLQNGWNFGGGDLTNIVRYLDRCAMENSRNNEYHRLYIPPHVLMIYDI